MHSPRSTTSLFQADLPHAALNPTSSQPAVMHVAMATDQPNHTFVDKFFSQPHNAR